MMGNPTLRVLEFYSGIGGLRYSLENSGVDAVVVEAFDINDVANDVYEHNFGHRPNQGNIQGLSVKQLDNFKADAWLLSPPCQPYTRQGLQKDADDARAISFLKMLEMLPLMSSPPTHVLVENVVGFENSVTHGRLLAVLKESGFATQEFILSPLQFGIPYSRPRYFCLGKKSPLSFLHPDCNGQLLCKPGPLLYFMDAKTNSTPFAGEKCCEKSGGSYLVDETLKASREGGEGPPNSTQVTRNEPFLDPSILCRPVGDYLEKTPSAPEEVSENRLVNSTSAEELSQEWIDRESRLGFDSSAENSGTDMDHDAFAGRESVGVCIEDQFDSYKVPTNIVQRWIDAYDIVTPVSRRCCCFTKSYMRYAKGTGSFLATKVTSKEGLDSSLEKHISDLRARGESLTGLGLRYFTPREVANLHSFPKSFTFPVHIRLRQRYALLGNSLSITVVGTLLKYLFASSEN